MRVLTLVLTLAVSQNAPAGILTRCCLRLIAGSVQDDPYQYELAPDPWIEEEIDRLRIKQAWGRATANDLSHLKILEGETARRIEIERMIKEYRP